MAGPANEFTRRHALSLSGALTISSIVGQASGQTYSAPGVYVEELSPGLVGNVPALETSLAAFIGYTTGGSTEPQLVTNYSEFIRLFGDPPPRMFELADINLLPARPGTTPAKLKLKEAAQSTYLYDAVRLFFENGGARCIIASAGKTTSSPDRTALQAALTRLNDPSLPSATLLAIPDAVTLSKAECFTLQQAMLADCDAAPNRFALLDIPGGFAKASTRSDPIEDFRQAIGMSHRTFGAAYAPWLIAPPDGASDFSFLNLTPDSRKHFGTFVYEHADILLGALSAKDRKACLAALADMAKPGLKTKDAEATHILLGRTLPLYTQMLKQMADITRYLPPSGAVAGAIARQDSRRGVWAPPASLPITGSVGLSYQITDAMQADFNTPADGYAVNAIREFERRGRVIWGARTLDGNSNDYRYISTRRLLSWTGACVQQALKQAVFEPNAAPLWRSIQSGVETFLYDLYRSGALQGSKPGDAFFARCGLGTSMTQSDIESGRLVVELGLAPLQPAEFIILRLSQDMAAPD